MPYVPTKRGVKYASGPLKCFKIGRVEDGPTEMRDLAPSLISVRFEYPGIPGSLFPIFGKDVYAAEKPGDSLARFLRHHRETRYDANWGELRKLRNNVPDPVWRAAAFALCVQCAAEELIAADALGDVRTERAIKTWMEKKLVEHVGQRGDDISEVFWVTLRLNIISGETWFEDVEGAIRFAVFEEYEHQVQPYVDSGQMIRVDEGLTGGA